MLDFAAVRVGFVTQLLWDRYGPLWRHLVEDAGAEAHVAEAAEVRAALADPRLAAVAPLAFRLAAAQALALAERGVDALVVPELNPDGRQAPRGGGADPWIADFPDALRSSVAGLPPLVAVPASLEGGVERIAVTTLHNLLHDAHAVRRIWARRRAEARPPRRPAPRWTAAPGARRTVGVVAQPWLLNDALAARATADGEHLVSQHRLDPARLREEGARVEGEVVATDAEVLGAARLFARRGGVDAVRLLVDPACGADAWLAGRLQAVVRKPLDVRSLDDVLAGADPVDILLVTPVE